ncbi:MAG: hypothetical protein WD342_06595 [Verrucomicrobiales bacterium]
MSEPQKLFASLSGAFIAHLLLFIAVFLFLGTQTVGSSKSDATERKENPPREVTILMGDLLEAAEVEPAPARAKSFVAADLNEAEAEAPENARFESDRNTSASTERLPDPDLPQEYGPTLDGDAPIPFLQLENRDHVDGRLEAPPSSASAPLEASPPPGASGSIEAAQADLPPEQEDREGQDDETVEGQAELPPGEVAETARRPKVDEADGEDESDADRRTFVDPDAEPEAVASIREIDEEERHAAALESVEEVGDRADLAEEKSMAATRSDGEGSRELPADPPPGEDAVMPADDGLFADGFSPEERRNSINGTLTNIGQNAVDAEETPLGRYKKSVREAIAVKWHRYRQDKADFVTWGVLKLEFRVDRQGSVHGLRITENKANTVLAEFSVKAIMDADVPAMPAEVAESVGSAGLEIKYDIIIY